MPGQVLTSNGSGSAPTWTNSGGSSKVAILSDVKTAGTDGGDFNTGAWRNRELNTELDPESFVTFNSSNNYFELERDLIGYHGVLRHMRWISIRQD